jgi:hypothetical protein
MRIVGALLAVLATAFTAGAAPEVHGHAKLQLSYRLFRDDDLNSMLAGSPAGDGQLDLRLNTRWRRSRWDLKIDTQLLALDGDSVRAANSTPAGGLAEILLGVPNPSDDTQWFDLSQTFTSSGSSLVFGRFDRFSVGYTGNRFVARLGRQALSWGGGLVFQVLDLFNPFSPTVIDTDYKPGADMLSTQWLLPGGDDLQAVVVPRRAGSGEPVAADQSSLAVRWHHFAGGIEVVLMGARHYDDDIAGAGASFNVAGGILRVNATYTDLADGDGANSLLVNLDHSWVLGGRNAYGFAEYFRNGFGVGDLGRGISSLPPSLLDRLARGELFNLGRNELAVGFHLEWTPLLTFEPTVLLNLDDGSSMLIFHLRYDWLENFKLDAGLQAGLGPRGTEYGGVPVGLQSAYAAPGRLVWLRLCRSF